MIKSKRIYSFLKVEGLW